jgi:hypothetical protein
MIFGIPRNRICEFLDVSKSLRYFFCALVKGLLPAESHARGRMVSSQSTGGALLWSETDF